MTAGFIIGATLRSGWNARHEAQNASPFPSPAAAVHRHFCLLRTADDDQKNHRRASEKARLAKFSGCARPSDRMLHRSGSPVRLDTKRGISISPLNVEIDIWLGSISTELRGRYHAQSYSVRDQTAFMAGSRFRADFVAEVG
jgi:hypothetical protein